MSEQEHTDFIAALGKAHEVVEFLVGRTGEPVSEDAVYKWKERGRIPPKWLPWLRLMAAQRGVEIPSALRDPTLQEA